jgi:PHD-zinc-finger like domain
LSPATLAGKIDWVPRTRRQPIGPLPPTVAGGEARLGAQVSKARLRLLCTLCGQQHGACIQCAGSRACCTAFHPLCARDAGLAMVSVDDDDDEEASGDEVADCGAESFIEAEDRDINAAPAPAQPGALQSARSAQAGRAWTVRRHGADALKGRR